MRRTLFIIAVAMLLLFSFCDNPGSAGTDSGGAVAVTARVLAKAQASSTYRITISGPGMTTIGPDEYAGGQTIELYVPEGADRVFYFERYDANSVLIDTGTTITDIGSEMRSVTVA